MRFLLKTVLAISVLFLLVFSSSATSMSGGLYDDDLNRHLIDPGMVGSSKEPFEMSVPYGSGHPVVGDGFLYFSDAEFSSTLYALDIANQNIAWKIVFSGQINKIIYEDGKLYFGADDFYCLNAKTGEQIWVLDAGRSHNIEYSAKVYKSDVNNIYGVAQYSNMKYLKIIDKTSGQYRVIPEFLFTRNINDFTIWDNNIYLTLGSSGSLASTKVTKINLTTYIEISTQDSCRTGSCRMVIDKDNSQIILSSISAGISSYKLDDLSTISPSRMINANRFVKYNNTLYTVYGEYFKALSATNTSGSVERYKVLDDDEFTSSPPLVVNEYLFATTDSGSIWSRNLETGQMKLYRISDSGYGKNLLYAYGYIISIIVYKIDDNWNAKIAFLDINNLAASPRYEMSVDNPYEGSTFGQNQFLGQLHCHVEIERPLDWTKIIKVPPTAWDVENRYKNAGYDFIALTEHNSLIQDPGVEGITHIVDSEEITQGAGGNHILAIGINEHVNPEEGLQDKIDAVNLQGGLPILAHPNSKEYPLSFKQLFSADSYNHLEIFNNAMNTWKIMYPLVGSGYAFDKWDQLLSIKKEVYGTANDDYTPYDAGFDGGAVVVFAPSSAQTDIMQALNNGNFYAIQGSGAPRINIQTNESSITIYSNQISNIRFIGDRGKVLQNTRNVTSATYSFLGNETYVRAEITSSFTNKKAWTQPIFIDSKVHYENLGADKHTITAEDAFFKINTSGDFTLKSVSVSDLPKSSPPAGYLANTYSLNTSGEVLNDNVLTYSYKGINLPVNEELLRIFRYNDQSNSWQVVPTVVDTNTKTVTASLPHYSIYTLSAEISKDQEEPVVVLSSPTDLENISGEMHIQVEASDNQAVTNVRFILDDKLIDSDIIAEDGWSAQYDVSNIVSGSYKLLIEAEDFSGNIGSAEYVLNVNSQLAPPTISIITPAQGDIVKDVSEIKGYYTSDLDVQEIAIYLDDVFLNKAEQKDGQFSNNIDWEKYNDGEHTFRVEMIDVAGNTAIAETMVRIGDKISVKIVSPVDKDYLRGTLMPLQIEVVPEAKIEIYIDGKLLEDVIKIDLLNYSLGNHIIEVKYKGESLATSNFNIITSYQDTINIIRRLEKEGGFTNRGVSTAIIAHLRTAQIASILGYNRAEQILLRNLERFIEQQSKGKKPKITQTTYLIIKESVGYLISY